MERVTVFSRRSLLRSALASAAVLLAACAPAMAPTPTTPAEKPGVQPTPTAAPAQKPAALTPTPTTAGKPAAPMPTPTPAVRQAPRGAQSVITFYTVWGGSDFRDLGTLVELFEKKQGNKIGVELVYTPAAAGVTQYPKLMAAVAAGQPPDIANLGDYDVPQWQELGQLTNLEAHFRRDGLRLDMFWPFLRPSMSWKGGIWHLGFGVSSATLLLWNKDLFKESGLDPEKGPKTIDDIDQYDAAITKLDAQGRVVKIGIVRWTYLYTYGNAAVSWGYAFGGQWTDENYTQVTADHPANIAAFEWVAQHAKRVGGPDKLAIIPPGFPVGQRFATGNVGMDGLVPLGLRQVLEYKKDFNYGIGPLPHNPKTGGKPNPSWGGGFVIVIPKGAKNVDTAWEFMRWVGAEEEGAGRWYEINTAFTGRRDLPWVKRAKENPIYRPYVELLDITTNTRPMLPVSNFYFSQLHQAMEHVAYGRKEPKEALLEVKNKVTAEWERFKKESA
jgi:multiple sugar transport system substrate-binding protein